MKRLFNILIISVIYLGFCGKSCVDESERTAWQENQAERAKDSIRVEFEAESLSPDARFAAEIKAMQNLKDLSDYIKIYTDDSIDSLFRAKAGELIRGMFESEENHLSFGPINRNKIKNIKLRDFLKKKFGKDILKGGVVFDSIHISQPLEKYSEGNYSGIMSAYQTVKLFRPSDSLVSSNIPILIYFTSSRQNKIIGQDTLNAWEVSLGDIVIID